MQDNDWIPIGKRIPEPCQKILATLQCKDKSIVTIINYCAESNMAEGCRLTAWMPAPVPFRNDVARMYMMICMYTKNSRKNRRTSDGE